MAGSSSPQDLFTDCSLHAGSASCFDEEEEEEEEEERENNILAQFLEAEVLGDEEVEFVSSLSTEESIIENLNGGKVKRRRVEAQQRNITGSQANLINGAFGKIPMDLFQNIFKFLSSEDLSTCCKVCQVLRCAASDEVLWRRLYCLRWGIISVNSSCTKPRVHAWKQLYFERDEADMREFVRNSPPDFREYYVQMQAAKRSQVPLPSQIKDDTWAVAPSVADQVTAWRKCCKLNDKGVGDHLCSGRTCSYHQIGDVFLCEKTGCAHVCDDTCRETILDPSNELLVCTISGRCFDRWVSPAEEETEPSQQLYNTEADPFLGSCRLARAYWLGYNCIDERELHEALREVLYPRCR